MIEVRGLTKRYGAKTAVDDLTFGIEPGKVTGFLGPNGAGKTTTMRCILGLDYADEGTVTVDGKVYPDLAYPMREVGALLDAKAVHGGRSAYNHLLCLAQTNNLPSRRVNEVLELVGLSEVARKRSKGFSLGMSQRLGIAATMLGDPKVLMFDEPVNGLDPEGILWIRNLMKALASEGRTVFVSSHLMSEMEYTADHLIVIGRGRLIADCSMSEFISRSSGASVRVRTPMAEELIKAVTAKGAVAATADDDAVEVRGLTEVARKRSKGFSLGMSQRLGIAGTLLGDPKVLMFDEPVNGLDPEGILWIRNLMKALASEGRTVFVSSHLMSEMENTADHLIVIGRGKLIADCTMAEFIAQSSGAAVRVRTPSADEFTRAITAKGATVAADDDGALEVRGMSIEEIGDLAFTEGIRLHELAAVRASLEEAFMELTASSVEYRADVPGAQRPRPTIGSGV